MSAPTPTPKLLLVGRGGAYFSEPPFQLLAVALLAISRSRALRECATSLRGEMRAGEETGPSALPLNDSGDLKSEGKPGHQAKTALWKHPAVLTAIIVAVVVIIVALAAALGVEKSKQLPPFSTAAPGCPDGWFRTRGRCYYFSKAEGDWTNSQNNCSSRAASLAGIENLQELASLLPYPGRLDHWIGLRKDPFGVWRWVNGTKFDRRFEIQGGADCAYLDGDLNVGSSKLQQGEKMALQQT